MLGRLKSQSAGEQIREFMANRRRYQRRHGNGREQLPSLEQLMEDEDLEQIRVVMTARFVKEDREKHPEEYQRRVEEEADSEEEEEDDEQEEIRKLSEELDMLTQLRSEAEPSESSPMSAGAPKAMKAAKTPAATLIRNRKAEFEASIFAEENLLAALRMIYGPKNLVQAVEILKAVKMDKNQAPYRSLQNASEYVARYFSNFIRLGTAGAWKSDDKVVEPKPNGAGSRKKTSTWTAAVSSTNKDSETAEEVKGSTVKKQTQPETPKKTTREAGERLCFICDQPGHLANACPSRSQSSSSKMATPVGKGTPVIKVTRSLLRSGSTERRAVLACCIGAVAGPEPTLQVQVNIDSLSDVNLLPSQWLVVLRGEGRTHAVE